MKGRILSMLLSVCLLLGLLPGTAFAQLPDTLTLTAQAVSDGETTLPEEDTLSPEAERPVPEEDTSASGEDSSLPEEDTTSPEEDAPASKGDPSLPEEDTTSPEEDAPASGEDSSLSEEDAASPEEGTSASEGEPSLPEEDAASPEETPSSSEDAPLPETNVPSPEEDAPSLETETPLPEERTGVSLLMVNGQDLLAAQDYTLSCGDGTAVFDPATATLTLTDAQITQSYSAATPDGKDCAAGIYAEGALTLVLEGANTIAISSDAASSMGIFASGALTIQGTGSLDGAADKVICALGLTISGGSISAVSDDSANPAISSLDGQDLLIEGGNLTVSSQHVGLLSDGNLSITGGTIQAQVQGYNSLFARGVFSLDGPASLSAQGGEYAALDAASIIIGGKEYLIDNRSAPTTVEIVDGQVLKGLRQPTVLLGGQDLREMENYTMVCGEGTAVYDPEAQTLTLTDVQFSEEAPFYLYFSYSDATIYADRDLTVILEGENTVSSTEYAIHGCENLTLTGSGSLSVNGTVYSSRDLALTGAAVFQEDGGNMALYSGENLCFQDSHVESVDCDTGLYAYSSINIQDSYVEIVSKSDAINCNGSVAIGGESTVTVVGESGYGIHGDSILISGGEVSAVGLTCGIHGMLEPITITGGTITAESTGLETYSSGIFCFGPIVISGTPTITAISNARYATGISTWENITVQGKPYAADGPVLEIRDGEILKGLQISGVQIGGTVLWETGTVELGGGTVTYDKEAGTLTLSDVELDTPNPSNGYGLSTDLLSLTIILEGTNRIGAQTMNSGIYSRGILVIQGPGSLEVTGLDSGIYASGVTVKDCTLTARATEANNTGAICSSSSDVILEGSTVTASASGTGACGIRSNDSFGSVTVESSTVQALGEGPDSCGIYSSSTVSLTDSMVSASGESCGIRAFYLLEVASGSTVSASGNTAALWVSSSYSEDSSIRPVSDVLCLPSGYLPAIYHSSMASDVEYDTTWGNITHCVFSIVAAGDTLSYDLETDTLTGAATSLYLTAPAPEDDSDSQQTQIAQNDDGSTSTTVTRPDGSSTVITQRPDGSKETVDTKKDGTVITTETDSQGNQTQTTKTPDGPLEIQVTQTDGSHSTTKVDGEGQAQTVTTLSEQALQSSQAEAVTLPIPAVTAAASAAEAQTVTLELAQDTAVTVKIPVENVTASTVAVLVREDGTEAIVKTSVPENDGVTLCLQGGQTVKIVDNAKDFSDVTDTYWGADAVDFVSSRQLMEGTGTETFSPEATTSRAMFLTALARLDGVDTTQGAWYDAAARWASEAGISDARNLAGDLTWEQLAAMLYRYAQYRGYDLSASGSTEPSGGTEAVSDDWAAAMEWALSAGILTDGLSHPTGSLTRAQTADALMRFVSAIGTGIGEA